MKSDVKVAPKGFSLDQMREFLENGVVLIQDAISSQDVSRYLDALQRIKERHSCLSEHDRSLYGHSPEPYTVLKDKSDENSFCNFTGIVGLDRELEELIDHERHIGFVYDIFGELTKLHISEAFIRPDCRGSNPWHVDGPRMVPFTTYSNVMPLTVRIGYNLTDTLHESMGNLVVLPGSHRRQYFRQADSWERVDGERILLGKSGSMSIQFGSLWHRVDGNTSGVARSNISIGYCPSWVTAGDQVERNPRSDWVGGLTRERRIILRAYDHPYDFSKPPVEDIPLYLDRNEDPYPERFEYPQSVAYNRQKHPTLLERFIEHSGWHHKEERQREVAYSCQGGR